MPVIVLVRLMGRSTSQATLFVFGTLKQGFPLHSEGMAGATFLGAYRTVKPYPMLVAGPWFAPMMLNQPGKGRQVLGELYRVSDRGMNHLDALESIGQAGNLKVRLRVEPIAGGAALEAWAYLKAPRLATPRHTGFLAEYLDGRFVPPWQRGETIG